MADLEPYLLIGADHVLLLQSAPGASPRAVGLLARGNAPLTTALPNPDTFGAQYPHAATVPFSLFQSHWDIIAEAPTLTSSTAFGSTSNLVLVLGLIVTAVLFLVSWQNHRALAHFCLTSAQNDAHAKRLEQLKDSLIAASPQPIFIKTPDLRYISANEPFAQIHGLSAAAIVGKTDAELFPPELVKSFRERDQQVFSRGLIIMFEDVLETPKGPRRFLVTKFPIRDEKGQIYALGGIGTDLDRLL